MKFATAFLLLWAGLAFGSHSALAHGDFRVVLEPSEEGATYGPGAFGFDFYLIDTELEKLVLGPDTGSDQVVLRIFDAALGKLSSGVATYNPGSLTWHADLELPYGTEYGIWAEGALTAENLAFLGGGMIEVNGAPQPAIDPLSDVAVGSDEGSIVTLSNGDIVAEHEAELTLKFARADGAKPAITCKSWNAPCADLYLATEDGDGLFHVIAVPNADGSFTAKFTAPEEGKYRAWVLYDDATTAHQIPLGFTAAP